MPATATTYQPHLLDPHSAEPQPIHPANGRSFRLAELYRLLDCQTVDVVRLTDELILIIDDVRRIKPLRKFRQPCYLNLLATYLWYQHQPEARGQDSIVGRAILCHDKQFR
ncbi:hypothetical protein [Hymenobacter sp. APR13]|uniref:hypothetical protein n=1 Tax=Hymenobacter sp. APR13 TaxID=1356852 RepID=UPI0004E030B8|nr:hypothetical protein [Hymenobacter sp. APR13]AII50837.1 hypothetical protein N008_02425 [Hymenobacter sp. APR13]